MKNTSRIGAVGELAVTQHLLSLGYDVFKDVSGGSPIDLIALKDSVFTRIQVKCHASKNGCVSFSRYASGREIKKKLEGHEFDVMAVYVRDKNLCLFMRIEELVKNDTGVVVRFEPTKNNVKKTVHWYESYVRM